MYMCHGDGGGGQECWPCVMVVGGMHAVCVSRWWGVGNMLAGCVSSMYAYAPHTHIGQGR